MKQSILFSALLMIASISAIANNSEGPAVVNAKVLESFNREFATAASVKWEEGKKFSKATFKMESQVLSAYFSHEGDLLAVTRNLTAFELPVNLYADMKEKYADCWITDLFEITSSEESAYFVTLKSADQTIVLKSVGSNGWFVYKKEKN